MGIILSIKLLLLFCVFVVMKGDPEAVDGEDEEEDSTGEDGVIDGEEILRNYFIVSS